MCAIRYILRVKLPPHPHKLICDSLLSKGLFFNRDKEIAGYLQVSPPELLLKWAQSSPHKALPFSCWEIITRQQLQPNTKLFLPGNNNSQDNRNKNQYNSWLNTEICVFSSHLVSVCLLVLVGKGFLWQTGDVWEHIFTQRGSWFCGMQRNPDRQSRCCVPAGVCCRLLTQAPSCCVPRNFWAVGNWPLCETKGHVFPAEILGSWELPVCDDGTVSLPTECFELVSHLKAFGEVAPYFLCLDRSRKKKPLFFHGPLWKRQTATN